jgi:hypothetical protein
MASKASDMQTGIKESSLSFISLHQPKYLSIMTAIVISCHLLLPFELRGMVLRLIPQQGQNKNPILETHSIPDTFFVLQNTTATLCFISFVINADTFTDHFFALD